MKEKKCIDCGKEGVGVISQNGLCAVCARVHQMESAEQIRNKSGPYYEKWKEGLKRGIEE